jgi:hypothetical protein
MRPKRSTKLAGRLPSRLSRAYRLKPLSIRLPERQVAWLDRQAGDIDTRSALIRRLIDQAMKAANPIPK